MNSDILLRNNVKVLGEGTQPMLFAMGLGATRICGEAHVRLPV